MKYQALLLVLLTCGSNGCGTIFNTYVGQFGVSPGPNGVPTSQPPPKDIYGGVAFSGAMGQSAWEQESLAAGFVNSLYWWGIDLPISAVGDTLTLPMTVSNALATPGEVPPNHREDLESKPEG